MRQLSFILFVVLIIFSGCNDEEDDSFSKNTLYQTQWNGVLQFDENESSKECSMTISFETLSTGRYISVDLSEDSEYSKQTNLEYSIDGKIITIYGGVHNILLGDWWIEKSSKDSIILKREPNSNYESVLTLNRDIFTR